MAKDMREADSELRFLLVRTQGQILRYVTEEVSSRVRNDLVEKDANIKSSKQMSTNYSGLIRIGLEHYEEIDLESIVAGKAKEIEDGDIQLPI